MFERNATAIHIVCSFCVDDKNIVCATSRTIERMYCKKKSTQNISDCLSSDQ